MTIPQKRQGLKKALGKLIIQVAKADENPEKK